MSIDSLPVEVLSYLMEFTSSEFKLRLVSRYWLLVAEQRVKKVKLKLCDDLYDKMGTFPEVKTVIMTPGDEEAIPDLSDCFPNVSSLVVNVPPTKEISESAYFAKIEPLLSTLTALAIHIPEGRSSGTVGDGVFKTMTAWHLPKSAGGLQEFSVQGQIQLSNAVYMKFLENNTILSPDLCLYNVYRVFAWPSMVTDGIVQTLFKKYQHLRQVTIGSCLELSDDAFKYLRANDEGVHAGQDLESMYLCCVPHHMVGDKWLEPNSIKEHLPKLKMFRVASGRQFCTCGDGGCGSHVKVVEGLKNLGITWSHASPHW
eukprot:TRINITY_DN66355_c7_g7_i1.p1 TRINITY_DN66355_c7_g7~~TRINITY_DN66355_c7_g7_i1.p1  ORF type:complete len:314 (+),score=19.05 TRINITY_DN66355_c7_g7_i1:50-991(+)